MSNYAVSVDLTDYRCNVLFKILIKLSLKSENTTERSQESIFAIIQQQNVAK